MKKALLLSALLLAVLGAGIAYAGRQRIAQVVADATRPAVPPAQPAEAFAATATRQEAGTVADRPAGVDSDTDVPAPKPPTQVNLAVPFLLQAPYQNWVQPYEDACEEASSAMVHGYWTKKTYPTPERADEALTDLFAWERENLGTDKDADAAQVARMLREHYGHGKVVAGLREIQRRRKAGATRADHQHVAEVVALGRAQARRLE